MDWSAGWSYSKESYPPTRDRLTTRLSLLQKLMIRLFKAGEKGILYPRFIYKGILCNGLDRDSARG